jgi:trans-aconitate methyltransferase
MPTTEQARQWLERWDRQQEYYLPDREERFAVIADVVAANAERMNPLIIDIGAGPGSLSVRLLDRVPAAQIVAVDADAMLLGLARAAYGDRRNLRIVEQDLRAPGWVEALGLCRKADAIVSTTALHWLTEPELAALYRDCAALLQPGGVLVDGDNLHEPASRSRLGRLQRDVQERRAAGAGVRANEDWAAWWAAAAAAPELADLATRTDARPVDHDVPVPPTYDDHVRLLREAGFAEVGTVWQYGDDRVLVAVR